MTEPVPVEDTQNEYPIDAWYMKKGYSLTYWKRIISVFMVILGICVFTAAYSLFQEYSIFILGLSFIIVFYLLAIISLVLREFLKGDLYRTGKFFHFNDISVNTRQMKRSIKRILKEQSIPFEREKSDQEIKYTNKEKGFDVRIGREESKVLFLGLRDQKGCNKRLLGIIVEEVNDNFLLPPSTKEYSDRNKAVLPLVVSLVFVFILIAAVYAVSAV